MRHTIPLYTMFILCSLVHILYTLCVHTQCIESHLQPLPPPYRGPLNTLCTLVHILYTLCIHTVYRVPPTATPAILQGTTKYTMYISALVYMLYIHTHHVHLHHIHTHTPHSIQTHRPTGYRLPGMEAGERVVLSGVVLGCVGQCVDCEDSNLIHSI